MNGAPAVAPRRVGTGLWLGGAVVAVFAADLLLRTHWATSLLVVVVGCGALSELCRLLERAGIACHRRWAVLALAAALVLRAAGPDLRLGAHEARELSLAVLAAGFLGPFLVAVARADREVVPDAEPVRRAAATALALGYVGLLTGFLLELRMLRTSGLELTFVLLACVKLGDTAAFFVGRTVGRRALTPVSPRKTWEGSAASLAASVATALAAGVVLDHDLRVMAGFGLVVDLAGQGGDLLASYVKRLLGARDSASTFGELGGWLDVSDALLLAAPPGYLWAELLVARGG